MADTVGATGTADPAAGGAAVAPAFYARRGGAGWDWWTLLHPPYTLWNVSNAALGAALAPHLDWAVLGLTLLAFTLAIGVAAHALDEWNGRPMGTGISDRALWTAAIVSLAAAVALGVLTVRHSGPVLIPFILAGVVLVPGYNLELFGGVLHTDLGLALSCAAFPALVGYVAQAPPLWSPNSLAALIVTAGVTMLMSTQRRLSTPARMLRRRATRVTGVIELNDGTTVPLDRAVLLAPLDGALRLLAYAVPTVAAAVLLSRLPHW
jgi:hypothetical protein